MFRLDRVLALESRDVVVSRGRSTSTASAYVLQSLATLPWGWPIEVLLELSLEEAQRRIAPDLGTLQAAPGGVLFRTQADELDWMARLLVEIGCPFRIQHPPELRQAVQRLARNLGRQARRAPSRKIVAPS